MKHLKNFLDKTFHRKPKLPEEVRLNIIDICLELEDVGFRIFKNQLGFNKLGEREGFYPNISIFKSGDDELFSDELHRELIEDTIERLKDYMNKNGYSVKIEEISKKVGKYMTVPGYSTN